MREYRNFARCLADNLDGRFTHFFTRRDNPALAFLPCLLHRLTILPARAISLCQLRHVFDRSFPVANHSHPAPDQGFRCPGPMVPVQLCLTYADQVSGRANPPDFAIQATTSAIAPNAGRGPWILRV